ncbi:uncharacterized protein LOC106869084 [Octopus bimaculoides]|uniref:Uncharacterized protein n=1 Tax=Octopus bimaculoides TaxID=37653 RepID=A0A0L8HR99_OCTBM|nr:uncharacterized protein LOC106869084 [Octopus bimaculoides]XP_014770095.1 uncharacterized protein LOC106869084 [Octopus bimaculoides]XP_052832566.1 uncharacterized protein LOC106869084 [Octopus bimaculoides]|eukprot:XP_014770094.1 PREDICTED: uncharacterized protein LOC106869084 [Octopus bimaculoides]
MENMRRSFRTTGRHRRYLSLRDKENRLLTTPEYVKKRPEIEDRIDEECPQCTQAGNEIRARKQSLNGTTNGNCQFSRSASIRKTVVDAVGTLRRKISSTAQLMSQGSMADIGRRRSLRIASRTPPRCTHGINSIYSPFTFETPEKRKAERKWCDIETPTKLRREVEALTSDMQALASLTPNTLRSRASARKKSPRRLNQAKKFQTVV